MMKKKHPFIFINFRARRGIVAFFLSVFIVFVGVLLFLNFLVNPIIIKTGESKIEQISSSSVYKAVGEVLQDSISYDDLIHLVTDSSGKISIIQANSVQINILSRKINESTYKIMMKQLEEPLKIPLGSFSGIPIFTNMGPKVNFNLIPYGDIKCDFLSEFTSAGINQTQHKIYASVNTVVSVILPLNKINVKNSIKILICESVIIGEIPTTYLQSHSLDEMMNLVPN